MGRDQDKNNKEPVSYVCKVLVQKIRPGIPWCYLACNVCKSNEGISDVGGAFWCGVCASICTSPTIRAVLDPENCTLYAKLCSNLHDNLPSFPPEKESDGKEITFKHKMVAEVVVHDVIQKLLGTDKEGWPSVQDMEATLQLLRIIGKQLEQSRSSRDKVDAYMHRLDEMTIHMGS